MKKLPLILNKLEKFDIELSGENFWRDNICNDNLDEPPPYFTKGAFFYRTDLVEIVSSLPIDLLCFSTLNIYFDNILKFQQKKFMFWQIRIRKLLGNSTN